MRLCATLVAGLGVLASAKSASAVATSFESGVVFNNSVLTLVGQPVYGVAFGQANSNSFTTLNGITFSADPVNGGPPNVNYANNANAQVPAFFPLSTGLTTGDPAFDAVLNGGQVPGPSPSTLILNNLEIGANYAAMFIVADTRPGINPGRSISVTDGLTSPSQAYTFANPATEGLAGYVIVHFTATATTESINNNQPNGAQLNAVLLGIVPEPNAIGAVLGGGLLALRRTRRK